MGSSRVGLGWHRFFWFGKVEGGVFIGRQQERRQDNCSSASLSSQVFTRALDSLVLFIIRMIDI